MGMAGHGFRNAAIQQALDAFSIVRSKDQEIGGEFCFAIKNDLRRIAFTDRGIHAESTFAEAISQIFEHGFCLIPALFKKILHFSCKALALSEAERGRRQPAPIQNMKQPDSMQRLIPYLVHAQSKACTLKCLHLSGSSHCSA